ncbi:MAG: hypothetical protein ACK52W_01590 [Alphaproteobacteria bacterium]
MTDKPFTEQTIAQIAAAIKQDPLLVRKVTPEVVKHIDETRTSVMDFSRVFFSATKEEKEKVGKKLIEDDKNVSIIGGALVALHIHEASKRPYSPFPNPVDMCNGLLGGLQSESFCNTAKALQQAEAKGK